MCNEGEAASDNAYVRTGTAVRDDDEECNPEDVRRTPGKLSTLAFTCVDEGCGKSEDF